MVLVFVCCCYGVVVECLHCMMLAMVDHGCRSLVGGSCRALCWASCGGRSQP